jgi:hypothetical protein
MIKKGTLVDKTKNQGLVCCRRLLGFLPAERKIKP